MIYRVRVAWIFKITFFEVIMFNPVRILMFGFLLLLFSMTFLGCRGALKEEASCPEEALIPPRFFLPDISR